MDPRQVARTGLSEIFETELRALSQLLELFEREREVLDAFDPDALGKLSEDKMPLIQALETTNQQKQHIFAGASIPLNPEGIESMLDWCAATEELRRKSHRVLELTRTCQAANRQSGVSVNRYLKHVGAALDCLLGDGNSPGEGYSSNGLSTIQHDHHPITSA